MRHQEFLFSASVLGAAIALNNCRHPQNMLLGPWICHRGRQQKHGPSTLEGLAVTLAAILPSDETEHVREGQGFFRNSPTQRSDPRPFELWRIMDV
jgi:hypothetical protein